MTSSLRLAWLLPLLLAACGGPPKTSDLDGTWVGHLHSVGGACADGVQSTLLVNGEHIIFTPSTGVLQLEGHRKEDADTLHAQLLLHDMNHHPLPMVFEAHVVVEQTESGPALRIDGTYGTPTCRASVSLRRPGARPLHNLIGR